MPIRTSHWITTFHTPAALSGALTDAGFAHSLQLGPLSGRKVFYPKGGCEKPVTAHIAGSFSAGREGVCNFIVCCYAEAARAKCQQLPSKGELSSIVSYAVNCEVEQTFFLLPPMTPLEYVSEVAEPSLLSNVQTVLLRINPYELRKKAERLVILALAGKAPYKETLTRLENNLKTAPLVPFLRQAVKLKSAVVESLKIGVTAAAEKYGVAEFEINYVRTKCDSKTEKTTFT